ncbi:hypothetical protein ACB092_01G190500 [Castanea dentata]
MGGQANQIFDDPNLKEIGDNEAWHKNWIVMEGGDDICDSIISIGSSINSLNSVVSSSSSELVEDASSSSSTSTSSSSSSSSSSSPHQNGPLYELSELMVHLPMKRGLSKHYQWKSQSFTSLASVKSLEDLAKRTPPHRKKMKSCKSYGGGLDGHKARTSPKATISKKASRGSCWSSMDKRGSLLGNSRTSFPVEKNS